MSASACNPPAACTTHGRCWTHSDWADGVHPSDEPKLSPKEAKIVYLLGPPGVGKTQLARDLLGWGAVELKFHPKPKWTLSPAACAAGHYTGATFDGGDTVLYTGARVALEHWRDNIRLPLTILDGARFATRPSLHLLRAWGHAPRAVLLTASLAVLEARRAIRGSKQNPTWMRGAETRAQNFSRLLPCLTIDTSEAAPSAVLAQVRAFLERELKS